MVLQNIQEYTLESFEDHRGEIYTTYEKNKHNLEFNHDKVVSRYKNVLCGIHGDFQTWKLVTCLYGCVFAVIVDYRKISKDYLKYKTFTLSSLNKKQLLLPPGFGNSFLVVSDLCIYYYKFAYPNQYIDCDKQFTLRWNDPKLNIKWPIENLKKRYQNWN